MNHKDAYKAFKSKQTNRMNDAWGAGWRINDEGHKVTMTNRKTGEVHVGHREALLSGEWSKRIKWED